MKNTSIIERIEYAAQNGVYEIPLYVWNKTAKKLCKEGFVLTETKYPNIRKIRKGEGHYLISWKDSYISANDEINLKDLVQDLTKITGSLAEDLLMKTLSKNNIELTEANRMWLVAAGNQK